MMHSHGGRRNGILVLLGLEVDSSSMGLYRDGTLSWTEANLLSAAAKWAVQINGGASVMDHEPF